MKLIICYDDINKIVLCFNEKLCFIDNEIFNYKIE